MRFRLPGSKIHVRLFEKVETVDDQYKIVDCGLEYARGGIDSLAVGGAFHTLGSIVGKANAKADEADDSPESNALESSSGDVVDTSATAVPDTQPERELVAQS